MIQEIFIVHAQIVDSTGLFNELAGYPKAFKSAAYDNDIEKARQRAIGDWHDAMGDFAKRDDRQIQCAFVMQASSGTIIANGQYGKLPEIPAPEPSEPKSEV